MLYKKNSEATLSKELFANPTCEYRGTPFWSWNCKLNQPLLNRQIDYLKEMGFGGFHMHSRSGMATEYLSDEFMELIKGCVSKAKETDMLAWLYDEDRWPSGAAGGLVTKNPKFIQRYIRFTKTKEADTADTREASLVSAKPFLLAAYDIALNEKGELSSFTRIDGGAAGQNIWYVYLFANIQDGGWFNGESYVDTLSDEAMQEFIRITYESYKKAVGGDFGGRVPAIFTDEPQFSGKGCLAFAHSDQAVNLPFTPDFCDTFKEAYGVDLLEHMPELLWELPDGAVSKARYLYHDHACERFVRAFSDQCGSWCAENGLYLTGHMLEEPTLHSQTAHLGEAMRSYRSFGLPGIDILCDRMEFTTAKQAQSAVHQYGREGMLSELYGVTNWDFDFRGHKFQGDWQAALGVTVRVPHLSWVSMKGSAKRDYPASISYQSPWYKEYGYVENHFARLNTALTRGKSLVNVGVIHPVESYWLRYGPSENTASIRKALDENFANITEWLLTGLVDFDYISESLLPDLQGTIGKRVQVGEMAYSTIVVPGCETLRSTTLTMLEEFKAAGGNVVFIGDCPKFVDAERSDAVRPLYEACTVAQISRTAVMDALASEKQLEIRNSNGENTDNLLYALREDTDGQWLFIAHAFPHAGTIDCVSASSVTLRLSGLYQPMLYDTLTGEIKDVTYRTEHGKTVLQLDLYPWDSLLFKLLPQKDSCKTIEVPAYTKKDSINWKGKLAFRLEEQNVLLLDEAEFSLDGGPFEPLEEVLRIDQRCRDKFGFPAADGCEEQPWVIPDEPVTHFVDLRFTFESEVDCDSIFLAAEEAAAITFNGISTSLAPVGYYVDESILKYPISPIQKGSNELVIRVPFGKRESLESCYLLGDFGVRLAGCEKTVTAMPKAISFSSITGQGMPFYGGNLVYSADIKTPAARLEVRVPHYRGALVRVRIDGKDAGRIAYAPYTIVTDKLSAGKHTVEFVLFGNRHNTFGALHCANDNPWYGPFKWYQQGDNWCYEYKIRDIGILTSPTVQILGDAE